MVQVASSWYIHLHRKCTVFGYLQRTTQEAFTERFGKTMGTVSAVVFSIVLYHCCYLTSITAPSPLRMPQLQLKPQWLCSLHVIRHLTNNGFILLLFFFFTGYPSPHQGPYPMPQPDGYSMPPYPMSQPGYVDPGQAPPPGFHMGYQPSPDQPVMYQPGPVSPGPPMQLHEYGGGPPGPAAPQYQPSPAAAVAPMSVPVGVPPGLEYLTQVGPPSRESRAVVILKHA